MYRELANRCTGKNNCCDLDQNHQHKTNKAYEAKDLIDHVRERARGQAGKRQQNQRGGQHRRQQRARSSARAKKLHNEVTW